MKSTVKRNIIVFVCLLVICILSSSVLLLPGVIEGHDTIFHLTRLESLARSIENGVVPCYVEPEMLNGFGYATSLFYCDLLLYIPALFVVAGVNILLVYKLFMVLICCAVVLSTFYMAKEITDSDLCGIICCVAVACSHYYYVDMFYRGAAGESIGFVFVPWAIVGIYNILLGKKEKWWQLVVGFSGLLMSHILSFVVMCIVFAVIIIMYAAVVTRHKKWKEVSLRIKPLVSAVLVSVGLSAWFLFPMAEQFLTTEYLSSYFSRTYNPMQSAVRIRNLFVILDETTNDHNLGLPILLFALVSVIFFIPKAKNAREVFIKILTVVSGICLVCATSLFPWEKLDPYLNIIQFPFRLHLFTTVMLSLAGSYWLLKIAKKVKIAYLVLLIAVVISVFSYSTDAFGLYNSVKANNSFVDTEKEYRYYDENYLHINTNRTIFANRKNYAGTVRALRYKVSSSYDYTSYGVHTVTFDGNNYRKNSIELPVHYYYGYSVVDENGNEVPNYPSVDRGWLAVRISEYDSGTFTVVYKGTMVQKLSLVLSFAVVIYLIVLKTVLLKRGKSEIRTGATV